MVYAGLRAGVDTLWLGPRASKKRVAFAVDMRG